jgi:hypothetical protein
MAFAFRPQSSEAKLNRLSPYAFSFSHINKSSRRLSYPQAEANNDGRTDKKDERGGVE